jgi:hypothetical protein
MSFGTVQAEKVTTESGYSLGAGNATSFKNRLINGEMDIDQRNAGASVTASDTTAAIYTVDRWAYRVFTASAASKVSFQRSSVAPPNFQNSMLVTSLSSYSIGSSDAFQFRQPIEGFNVADLGWGTANAKTVTLSFWVRSSLTGTFGGGVWNATDTRFYVFSYTINAANTWEYKTVTITGETTGTWNTTNGVGMNVSFSLGAGTSLQGTPGSWGTSVLIAPTGQVNVSGTSGATFYITGVQLEVGTVATSFDFRDITREFQMCQRYLFRLNNTDGGYSYNAWSFRDVSYFLVNIRPPVAMRATPTLTDPVYSMTGLSTGSSAGQVNCYNINATGMVSVTAGTGAWDIVNSTNEKMSIRFTGTSLSGSSGNIAGVDAFITGSKFFLSAEL